MGILEIIKTEIVRRIEWLNTATTDFGEGRRAEIRSLLDFLDSLPEQPVEMDNEEKIRNFFDAIGDCGFSQYDILRLKSIWEDMSYSIPKQEQPVEGLEEKDFVEEVRQYYTNNCTWDALKQPMLSIITRCARHFAEWQKAQDQKTVELAEDHAMLAGMNKMEQQMMEKAVEGKVFMSFAPGHNQMVMADVDLPTNTKVKVIIVKEDEK